MKAPRTPRMGRKSEPIPQVLTQEEIKVTLMADNERESIGTDGDRCRATVVRKAYVEHQPRGRVLEDLIGEVRWSHLEVGEGEEVTLYVEWYRWFGGDATPEREVRIVECFTDVFTSGDRASVDAYIRLLDQLTHWAIEAMGAWFLTAPLMPAKPAATQEAA